MVSLIQQGIPSEMEVMEQVEAKKEAELLKTVKDSAQQLRKIWDFIGLYGPERDCRMDTFINNIRDLMTRMIKEEILMKENILKQINIYTKQIEQLCSELKIQHPKSTEEGLSLLWQVYALKDAVIDLEKQRDLHLEMYHKLQDEEKVLCDILQVSPLTMLDTFPSKKDLDNLRQHIGSLSDEKERRTKEFLALREEVLQLMNVLEVQPQNKLEIELISDKVENFVLSQANLEELSCLKCQLSSQRHQMLMQCHDLHERLKLLWLYLDIPVNEQLFIDHVQGCNMSVLKKLKEEVSKYEDLKVKKFEEIITNLKREIQVWSVKCCLSDLEQDNILSNPSAMVSDDLLEYFDSSLKKLQSFYSENLKFFEKFSQYREQWLKLEGLEKMERDPQKYKNRGGALLRHQREYSCTLNAILRLEKELDLMAEKWEKQNDKEFLLWGQTFKEFIKTKWLAFEEQKENQMTARHKEKLLMSSRSSTPTKRKFVGTPPSCALVRTPKAVDKSERIPKNLVSSKTKMHDTAIPHAVGSPAIDRNTTPRKRTWEEISEPLQPITSPNWLRANSSVSVASCESYSKFASELNRPCDDVHSTVLKAKTTEDGNEKTLKHSTNPYTPNNTLRSPFAF